MKSPSLSQYTDTGYSPYFPVRIDSHRAARKTSTTAAHLGGGATKARGLAGLRSRRRSGRPRRISRCKQLAVIAATMRPPKDATHWSARWLPKLLVAGL